MKLVVLYRPDSEHARAVETFIHDFQRNHEGLGRRLEVINVDSRDGMATMSLYDLVDKPALMVLNDDSQMVKEWQGPQLPLMDEVAGYFYMAGT
jgi:hypothetical protein